MKKAFLELPKINPLTFSMAVFVLALVSYKIFIQPQVPQPSYTAKKLPTSTSPSPSPSPFPEPTPPLAIKPIHPTLSAQTLPTTLDLSATRIAATDTHFYVYHENHKSPDDFAVSQKNLYVAPLNTSSPTDTFQQLTSLPLQEQMYSYVRTFSVGNYFYLIGFRNLAKPGEYPQFQQHPDVFKTTFNADGSLGQWEKQAASLPNGIPFENGGFTLKTNGHYVFLIMVVDDLKFPVYKSKLSESGTLGPWENIGTLPAIHHGYLEGEVGSYVFSKNRLFIFKDETQLFEYQISDSGDLHLIGTRDIAKGRPNLIQDQYFTFIDNDFIYFIDGSLTEVWRADLEKPELSFIKYTDIITNSARPNWVRFAKNNTHLYMLMGQTDERNQTTGHHIITVRLNEPIL